MKKIFLIILTFFLSIFLQAQEKSNYEKYREAKDKVLLQKNDNIKKDTIYIHDTILIKTKSKNDINYDFGDGYDNPYYIYPYMMYPTYPLFYYSWYPFYWCYSPSYWFYPTYYWEYWSFYHNNYHYWKYHDYLRYRFDNMNNYNNFSKYQFERNNSHYPVTKYTNYITTKNTVNKTIFMKNVNRKSDYIPAYSQSQRNLRPTYNTGNVLHNNVNIKSNLDISRSFGGGNHGSFHGGKR